MIPISLHMARIRFPLLHIPRVLINAHFVCGVSFTGDIQMKEGTVLLRCDVDYRSLQASVKQRELE